MKDFEGCDIQSGIWYIRSDYDNRNGNCLSYCYVTSITKRINAKTFYKNWEGDWGITGSWISKTENLLWIEYSRVPQEVKDLMEAYKEKIDGKV